MKIKDIVKITGGNTRITIYGQDDNSFVRLFDGIVDEIDFKKVPYGFQEVCHISVPNDENGYMSIYFDYPKTTQSDINICGKLSVGTTVPFEWVYGLYLKYSFLSVIEEILSTKTDDEIYDEIKAL